MTDEEALNLKPGDEVLCDFPSLPGGDFYDRKISHTVARIERVSAEDRINEDDRVLIYLDNGECLHPPHVIKVHNLGLMTFSDDGNAKLGKAIPEFAADASYANRESIKGKLFGKIEENQKLTVFLRNGETIVINQHEWDFRQ